MFTSRSDRQPALTYILLSAVLVGGCAAGGNLDSLVESERAFAVLSRDRGTRAAFLSFLDDSAVIFRPHPVNGKEWFGGQPSRPSVLAWEPEFADCSAEGDLGYTTGPWKLFGSASSARPVASGYFVSIWGRRPGGPWKVLLDVGTSTPAPSPGVDSVQSGSLAQTSGGNQPAPAGGFLEAERELRKGAERSGILEAYRSAAASECRFYRDGHFPAIGYREARSMIGEGVGNILFTLHSIHVSSSADLAYAYGRYEYPAGAEPGGSGYYLHVWQNSPQGIRLVLDLLSPLPRQ